MNSKKKPHRHAPEQAQAEARPSFFSNAVLLALSGVLGALLGYAGWQAYQGGQNIRTTETNSTPPAATAADATAQSSTPAKPADLQKLLGKWVRNDGGYVLDIKNAADDGKLEAVYLNPKPIHIARAEADMIKGKLRVFVEFQDVNYQGSTYDLRYDAAGDQLVGEYFQAGLQQRYQVGFERVK